MMANIFNPDKEFFVIDSDNVKSVQTQLYGFVVQDNGIIESDSVKHIAHPLSGCGTYVYVESGRGNIKIYQDFNGSYGLFLFQRDGYFAISNSFFYLLNHIKDKYPLTFNQDFAHYMCAMELCSESYSDTYVSEIKMLPKNVVVTINKRRPAVVVDYIDYGGGTVDIDSAMGLAVLDAWYARWTRVFREVYKQTNNIVITLSGGFDSRLTLMLALGSGIDLNNIRVYSANDDLHTHAEDFKIASAIAAHFGFQLNKSMPSSAYGYVSLRDLFNMWLYNKLPFHKEMLHFYKKFRDKQYLFTGFGGELIRSYWSDVVVADRQKQYRERSDKYGIGLSDVVYDSISRIEQGSHRQIADAYGISDMNNIDLVRNIYNETRARNHYGRSAAENIFTNYFNLSPFFDPALLKLKRSANDCPDGQLLMAVMFMRYCPDLMTFPVEGGRFIEPQTLEYAKQLCARFPISQQLLHPDNSEFILNTVDNSVDKMGVQLNMNDDQIDKWVRDIFSTVEFRNLITRHFNCSIYNYALTQSRFLRYFPLREIYPVICSGLVLHALTHRDNDLYDWFASMHGASCAYPPVTVKTLEQIITARIDIKLSGAPDAQFRVVTPCDNNTSAYAPSWLQTNGYGVVIESGAMYLDLEIVPNTDGVLNIYLRGKDSRDANGNKIPCWIDYTEMMCNDDIVFTGVNPAWHDKPLTYTFNVVHDTPVRIRLKWQPHVDTRTNI